MNLSRFLQVPVNEYLFRFAPMWVSTRYLHLLGSLYYIANRRERELIENNVSAVFPNPSEARVIIRNVFRGIFSHYSEKLVMAYRDLDALRREIGATIEYTGLEHLDRALDKGGVIIVTGHFGGVEFFPLALNQQNYPVSMVVSFQTGRLKKSLMERACENNVELIDGKCGTVLRGAVDALKRGRILLTECDEVDAWKRSSRTMNAFGTTICMDRSLEVLQKRTGATVLGGFIIREDDKYRLNIIPVEPEPEMELSAAILRIFEDFVMRFPDQWYQWKKFHKMLPETA